MAKAYVSYNPVMLRSPNASSVPGLAVYSAVLDFSSGQATTASGLTANMWPNRDDMVALVTADTDCWVAVGSTPDCTLQAAAAASSARMFLVAGMRLDVILPLGAKVACAPVT